MKEKYVQKLVSMYGQDKLIDKSELYKKMEEDGFNVVMDHAGEIKEDIQLEETLEENEKILGKRKQKQRDDFYKFQIKDKRLKGIFYYD